MNSFTRNLSLARAFPSITAFLLFYSAITTVSARDTASSKSPGRQTPGDNSKGRNSNTEVRSEKPNIIFILADDIGYGDLSCYGAKLVQTPNIDKLASQGCRFTDAHSPAATCTPTRRALLTGAYSWRQKSGSSILPGDASLSISTETVTLPSMLKKAGYVTGLVGKWHLGLGEEGGPDWNGEIRPGPLELGFDYAYYLPATGDRVPTVFIENHRVVNLDPADPIQVNYKRKVGNEPTGRENPELQEVKSLHGHDATIINGIGRIGWMSGGKAARWKDEEIADTFTSKSLAFIEKNRERPFFLFFTPHDIHVPRVPHPRFRGKSKAGTRGDVIVELDWCVGEVMAQLKKLNLERNTLLIFTSDNGGRMNDGYEDVGNYDHPCNGILRGYKSNLFEGGHRIPFISRWPGKISPGIESRGLFCYIDMLATMARLTGQTLPEGAAPDSLNVLPDLLGKKPGDSSRDELIVHVGGVEGPFGVRKGPWKLITEDTRPRGRKPGSGQLQLFHLARDLRETENVASKHPEKVRELKELLESAKAVGHTRTGQ